MQRGCAGRSWELLHVWQVINTGFVRSMKKHAQTDKFVHKFRVRNVLNVAIIKKKSQSFIFGGNFGSFSVNSSQSYPAFLWH